MERQEKGCAHRSSAARLPIPVSHEPLRGESQRCGGHNLGIARSILEPARRQRRHRRGRLLAATLLVALIAGGVSAVLLALSGGGKPPLLVPRQDIGNRDPLAFVAGQERELERSAAFGLAHVLYAKSPGGVLAAAERSATFRPLVERAADGSGIDADLLEAIVLLESGGRQDVIAGSDPTNAAGLTQILAETGRNFLGMHVELAASRRLTRNIAAAVRRGDSAAAARLRARRRRVDDRFDPAQGARRHGSLPVDRPGRDSAATISRSSPTTWGSATSRPSCATMPSAHKLEPIARRRRKRRPLLGAALLRRLAGKPRPAWRRLAGFGDDSQTYYWRVLAAQEDHAPLPARPGRAPAAHRCSRTARRARRRSSIPRTAQSTSTTPTPSTAPGERRRSSRCPTCRRASTSGSTRGLATRPPGHPARSTAVCVPKHSRCSSTSATASTPSAASPRRSSSPATVSRRRPPTPARARNREATQNYSLHTTGYAFDILRRYGSGTQAAAFQYELERLQARGLIAWVTRPDNNPRHRLLRSEDAPQRDARTGPGSRVAARRRSVSGGQPLAVHSVDGLTLHVEPEQPR